MVETEEFELVPASPIKRLDKRISKLEKCDSSSDIKMLSNHILDMVSSNQGMVERIVESNNRLRKDIARIPEKMDELIDEIKLSAKRGGNSEIKEMPIDSLDALIKQMRELIEHNRKHLGVSQASLDHLNEINKRLKRLYLHNAFASRRAGSGDGDF